MPFKPEAMHRWFAPCLKATQIRSKMLLAAQLSVAGTPSLAELKDILKVATNRLSEPRSDEESVFLEDLASRILNVELEESKSLVDRMILVAETNVAK